ncbi:MAG: hypothetical protein A2330_00635 [Ignavibacteria bacterium RIFOXYB2_FULL_36_7]|nr:MAG: hypothetical protein A2330_00635 [Ignavibacteria bacterium RIFOXYB2_FULL_36_7]
MKKLFREEKQGLKKELNGVKPLLIFFLFSQSVFSQIPINGFCKYNYYKADSGFTNFLTVNFNSDSYSDFILFNPAKKEVGVIKGEEQGILKYKKSFRVPLEITSVQPLQSRRGSGYFFSSRRKMQAGVYELKSNGKPNLLRSIEFDSYPDYLSIADIDGKGRNEILVSGSAFNGLSIIYQDKNELVEKKIIEGTAFSHSVLCDLNNDGSPDIAAYDIIRRRFEFLYNNSKGQFRKVRSIPFPERIINLKSFDINLDSYEDLLFASGKSFYIWYGDFRSSYENTSKIETRYKVDKYIIGDFNKDGKIDLAYLNFEHSLVSVLFSKNEFEFYPEIIYLQRQGLTDITPYYSRFINGIAALSTDGSIHTVTNFSSFAEVVDISLGAKPNALSFFDNENNGITDFCFIDEYDKKIKFVLRNSGGIPANFFSFQLHENHDRIISENLNSGLKNYICYSFDKKLIEIIKADFNSNKIEKTALYSPGPIKDLKLGRINDSEYLIYIVYTNNNSLFLGAFSYKDLRFNFFEQLIDTGRFYDASIGIRDELVVYYWQNAGQNVSLGKKHPGNLSEEKENVITIPFIDSLRINTYTGDLLNMEKDVSISFFTSTVSNSAVVTSGSFSSFIKGKESKAGFRITSKNNIFFGETRFNGLKKLCVYLPEKKVVNRLEFINKGRNIAFTEIADKSFIGSFFVKNMTSKNYHIVYTNTDKSCVTIKRIKG